MEQAGRLIAFVWPDNGSWLAMMPCQTTPDRSKGRMSCELSTLSLSQHFLVWLQIFYTRKVVTSSLRNCYSDVGSSIAPWSFLSEVQLYVHGLYFFANIILQSKISGFMLLPQL